MRKRGTNPDMCELFKLMARDESSYVRASSTTHRRILISVNSVWFKTEAKKYTFPGRKFIFYADLSLGENQAMLVTCAASSGISKNVPELRFHADFRMVREMVQ